MSSRSRLSNGLVAAALAAATAGCAPSPPRTVPPKGVVPVVERPTAACPSDMALVAGRFCVDRYEATLVRVRPDGREEPFPFNVSPDGVTVRAVSVASVYPQGYISGRDAAAACKAAGKRLCESREWVTACKGPRSTTFPYGDVHVPRRCNDHGQSPRAVLGVRAATWTTMNDPALNRVPDTVAKTGEHEGCVNEWGLYDMVGNLHEWVADPDGTFRGGYYLDASQNGTGCDYQTTAHVFTYHDYSTGFRCCRDLEAGADR